MIDLTHHLTVTEQEQVGPLLLSDSAAAELRAFLSAQAPTHSDPEQFGPIVAQSVAGFLTSDYFTRSTWFKNEPVHLAPVCLITTGHEQRAQNCNVIKSRIGHVIVAAAEHALAEDYFVRRLLEELRIEHGIPELTGDPRGRGARPNEN